MQKYHGSNWGFIGLEHIGAVPVLRKAFRIDGTALEITIDRNTLARVELLADFILHLRENLVFSLEIIGPIGGIDGFGLQLVRHEGVPRLERGPALRNVDAGREQRHGDHGEQQRGPPYELHHPSTHRPILPDHHWRHRYRCAIEFGLLPRASARYWTALPGATAPLRPYWPLP